MVLYLSREKLDQVCSQLLVLCHRIQGNLPLESQNFGQLGHLSHLELVLLLILLEDGVPKFLSGPILSLVWRRVRGAWTARADVVAAKSFLSLSWNIPIPVGNRGFKAVSFVYAR